MSVAMRHGVSVLRPHAYRVIAPSRWITTDPLRAVRRRPLAVLLIASWSWPCQRRAWRENGYDGRRYPA